MNVKISQLPIRESQSTFPYKYHALCSQSKRVLHHTPRLTHVLKNGVEQIIHTLLASVEISLSLSLCPPHPVRIFVNRSTVVFLGCSDHQLCWMRRYVSSGSLLSIELCCAFLPEGNWVGSGTLHVYRGLTLWRSMPFKPTGMTSPHLPIRVQRSYLPIAQTCGKDAAKASSAFL